VGKGTPPFRQASSRERKHLASKRLKLTAVASTVAQESQPQWLEHE
jgi:hypothetical protein